MGMKMWGMGAVMLLAIFVAGCSSNSTPIAVVVDPAFGDDEAGLTVADEAPPDLDRARAHQAVQPPSRTRFAPVM